MRKKSKKIFPKMQVEVWKMKERVYQRTRGMNAKQYFEYVKAESGRLSGRSKRTCKS
jgi:hypothetical protein